MAPDWIIHSWGGHKRPLLPMSAVVLKDHFASTADAKKSRNMHNVYVGAAVTFSAVD